MKVAGPRTRSAHGLSTPVSHGTLVKWGAGGEVTGQQGGTRGAMCSVVPVLLGTRESSHENFLDFEEIQKRRMRKEMGMRPRGGRDELEEMEGRNLRMEKRLGWGEGGSWWKVQGGDGRGMQEEGGDERLGWELR